MSSHRPTSQPAVADVTVDAVAEEHGLLDPVKPHLRGWLHAGMAPVAVVLGIVLVVLSPPQYRWAATLYSITAILLFGTSAVYHRFTWSERTRVLLKRLDHSNIFLIIAGSYTPFAVVLLPEEQERTLLILVWSGALAGVLFRVFWVGAPRWLYTPIYIALGWVAIFYLPAFWSAGGPLVVILLALGGIFYSVGGVVYALKRPNPSPTWFGFHEVFHALTLLGFLTQYVAVSLVLYGAR
ncbi:MAG TPA: hemolysin III family protein [Candidatus Nanopelagicales bacterium]|nr:hemolysin III family protein [Candidatus Nanopelagicales bacterium]